MIAAGVANAIYNVGTSRMEQGRANRTLREFEAQFEDRSESDRSTADRMIDFLVSRDATIQSTNGGYLSALLDRLEEVLSKPE